MGRIDEMGLGNVVVNLRDNGYTLQEIQNKLSRDYNCSISIMTVSNYLKSDRVNVRNYNPTGAEFVKDFCITFGRHRQKLMTTIPKDCANTIDKLIKDIIAELKPKYKNIDINEL